MSEVLFQHEIKDFSVVQLFVICPASHCSTEAFCLVLLPAMIEFPIGFVRFVEMVEWGAGKSAAWPEGSSSCCSYYLWCGNSRGHSHGARPEHGRCTVKTLSLPLKFTLPTCTKRICNSEHMESGSEYPEIKLCCLSGSNNMNNDDVNSDVQI